MNTAVINIIMMIKIINTVSIEIPSCDAAIAVGAANASSTVFDAEPVL
jgi:hypothetical protein